MTSEDPVLTLRAPDGGVVGEVAAVAELVVPDGRTVPVPPVRVTSDGGSAVHATGSALGLEVSARWSAPSSTGRREVRVDVRCTGTQPVDACLRIAVDLPTDPEPPWWLVPGVFYGENRPAGCARLFPRFAPASLDLQEMVSDRWAFRADRASTPAVLAWTSGGGVALVAAELSDVGMTGVGFAHDARAGAGRVHLTFPFREEPLSYDGSATPRTAELSTFRWEPGARTTVTFAAYGLSADRHGYAAVLAEQHRHNRRLARLRPWSGIGESAAIAAEGLWRWHYDPDPGVLLETAAFDRGISGADGASLDRPAMHVGWVSGIPWAYALLVHGRRAVDQPYTAAALRVIDHICAELSPSGTFWGVWYRGLGWSQSWSPVQGALHSRTLAEATQFLVRALELGDDLRERSSWVRAVRSNLDAVVARQRGDGNLGSAHHAVNGSVLSWEGAAGLAWVGALAEAGRWDGADGADGAYLRASERAGEYYAQFVEEEFLNGAPEDVDLAPSSEDGYVAVMAYMALHRRTGDARWLRLARRAADWTLTFRYTYDVTFPPGTLLERYDFGTRGADNASPSNQHLHSYGLVCSAELAELSRALGDPLYVERARETLACFRQLVPRFDGEVNAYRGMVTERYYQTACFQPKGMVLTLSHAWSVGVLLLACEQALLDPDLAEQPF
ncbi:hypothetical protein CELL_01348 [Cellulomonas sp. T2.31MG-18]|uniref:hypothetical protein n=1 Tax=Cellulomonas sp. T2.31MG-18 TaxID=3157619 RepID=UPI0035EB91D3